MRGGGGVQQHSAALTVTYEGGDPALLERLVALTDFIEISPDSISRDTGDGLELDDGVMADLENSGAKFLVHGVGLSIGSASGWSDDYIGLLDRLFERLPIAWHSEHLGYTMVDGEQLGTMLPPPRTTEALDLICERVVRLRSRYPVPFLLEHVVRIVPDAPGEYSEAGFFNALARQAGCEILIDAYNIECDAVNFGFDGAAFVDALDLGAVREMHVAGGGWHKGVRMDVHSQRMDAPTRARAADILARTPNLRAVTFEFLKQAVPVLGHDAICAELAGLKEMLAHAGAR